MKTITELSKKLPSEAKKGLALFILSTFLLQSCNKDEYEVINNGEAIPMPKALQTLFDNQEASLTTILTFDAATNLTNVSPKGVTLNVIGSCLRKNGNPVVGQVKVKYIEIFDKGSMISSNRPTMGLNGTSNELLYSGGEFFIQAYQDNVALTSTCPFSLSVPTSNTGGTQTGMLPFVGTVDANGNLQWEPAPPTFDFITNTQSSSPTYQALIPSFGWFNCDRFASTPGPKTTISARVPAGYGAVSSIFLSVKTFPNALGKSYGMFPVGLDCYLIFITEKDGKFRYAIKPQVLTASHEVTFNLSETTIGTGAQLTAAINALP